MKICYNVQRRAQTSLYKKFFTVKTVTISVIQISKPSGAFCIRLQSLSEIYASVLLLSGEDPYTKIMKEKEEELEDMEALQQALVAEESKGKRRWRT